MSTKRKEHVRRKNITRNVISARRRRRPRGRLLIIMRTSRRRRRPRGRIVIIRRRSRRTRRQNKVKQEETQQTRKIKNKAWQEHNTIDKKAWFTKEQTLVQVLLTVAGN